MTPDASRAAVQGLAADASRTSDLVFAALRSAE